MPLGVAAEVPYSQFAVPFMPGDVVMLYTDGLVEATDGAGKQLEEEGLLRMAEGLPVKSLQGMFEVFNGRFEAFRGTVPVADDLTMLFFRHTGDVSKAHLVPRKLRSYGKLLGLIPV